MCEMRARAKGLRILDLVRCCCVLFCSVLCAPPLLSCVVEFDRSSCLLWLAFLVVVHPYLPTLRLAALNVRFCFNLTPPLPPPPSSMVPLRSGGGDAVVIVF